MKENQLNSLEFKKKNKMLRRNLNLTKLLNLLVKHQQEIKKKDMTLKINKILFHLWTVLKIAIIKKMKK